MFFIGCNFGNKILRIWRVIIIVDLWVVNLVIWNFEFLGVLF